MFLLILYLFTCSPYFRPQSPAAAGEVTAVCTAGHCHSCQAMPRQGCPHWLGMPNAKWNGQLVNNTKCRIYLILLQIIDNIRMNVYYLLSSMSPPGCTAVQAAAPRTSRSQDNTRNLSPAFLFPAARCDKWKFWIDYKWLHQRTSSGGTKLNGEWILGIFKCPDVEFNSRHLPQPEAELISMCVTPSSNMYNIYLMIIIYD